MEQKQTAVGFIENAIDKYIAYVEGSHKAEPFTLTQLSEAVQQAKQMEKEQIIKAHKEGNKHNGWALRHEHEQYYKEEYGKDTTDNTNL